MEVGQADQVQLQKQSFLNKWYARSLGSAKVVYARDIDPSDTVIVRSLHPKAKEYQKVFGLKDVALIQRLFLSILKLLDIEMNLL